MNIDEITLGQIKQLQSLFNTSQNTQTNDKDVPFIGKYCIIRTRNAGVIFGKVLDAGTGFVHMTESRRLWRHVSEDRSLSWYEGVAISGLGDESRISGEVERFINEDYELVLCTEKAINSIKSFKTNETSC